MAKCIKITKGPEKGKIIRVPNTEAARAVKENLAEYSPKSDWKRQVYSVDE